VPTKSIITKLKRAKLTGRGGASFSTWQKWQAVLTVRAAKNYIICNASEGEPGVFKDYYLLKNYPKTVLQGIKIALETFKNSTAYLYLNPKYFKKFKRKLKKLITDDQIQLFKKPHYYLAGEESTILNVIEGKSLEPRLKPPYPCDYGLFGKPTLINNVETFYDIALIAKDKYQKRRFYSISGDVPNKGVFRFPETWPAEEVLKESDNYPDFDFFVQAGGGVSGEILLPNELSKPVGQAGALVVYNRKKTDLFALMKTWIDFFMAGNCDKCVPCREGAYRIAEMIKSKKMDKTILNQLFSVLEQISFCPLGRSIPVPFRSLIEKVLE